MSKKVVLIDGSSLSYRAFYALGKQVDRFVNHEGLHTNAIYSFKLMLDALLEKEKPEYWLVAFDKSKKTFRHEQFSEYKAGRKKTPPEFLEQLPYIKELIADQGGTVYELEGYEADDIIGTMAQKANQEEVVIYTGDRDLFQLVTDHVTVKWTKKGVKEVEEYTPEAIFEKYQLAPKQIIDLKGLAGDTSDNIPGVTKVGEKTAIKLLTQYHSVENLYEHIDELKKSKMKEHLIADKEQAFLSKELATIETNAPIALSLKDIKTKPVATEALIELYEKLDFKQFLKAMDRPKVAVEKTQYQWVDQVTAEMFHENQVVHLELFEENYHTATPIGLAWGDQETIYVGKPDLIKEEVFQQFLANDEKKWFFDVKKHWVLAQKEGITLGEKVEDIYLGSYLLDTLNDSSDVESLTEYYDVSRVANEEEIYGKGAKRAIPEEEILSSHLANKVKAFAEIVPKMRAQLEEKNQMALYETMEVPLAFVLAKMEYRGIKVDVEQLKAQEAELGAQIKEIEEKIYTEAGHSFNLNSPKQLGEVLFDELGLPVLKRTKTGYSTSVDVLEKLEPDYPIVRDILTYRQWSKLQSTYVTGLLKQVHADGKVHTRYMQGLTQTGRLSSVDPNLQNIPVRMEEGKRIRKAFVPENPDWYILTSDYSQIELRVLASICQDASLEQAFRDGEDIHDSTARRIFHLLPGEEVTPKMRREAKAVNFGVVYGISDYGLSENLGITRKEAKAFIDQYFHHYPGVKRYMDAIVEKAKEDGYVETLFARRRYLPDIHSRNFNVRSFAERTAINSPIQGSAADILKIAMNKMAKELENSNYRAHLLLQVHDEVILEVHPEDLEAVQALVEKTMDEAVKLSVPLVTDSSYGKTWYDAK